MLFEFDADQRLWQDTVRDAVGKQCPPTLVRSVAEDGSNPTPLWRVYVDQGWAELTNPANAVEPALLTPRPLQPSLFRLPFNPTFHPLPGTCDQPDYLPCINALSSRSPIL
jgi:hypothetical protein